MGRPIYQTREDDARQRAVANKVAKGREIAALPKLSCVDFGLIDEGRLVVWLEVKCRTCTQGEYPTYIIAKRKVDDAHAMTELTKLPVWLVVQWTDALGWMNFDAEPKKTFEGGRKDRGDPADIEPMNEYRFEDFHIRHGDGPLDKK